jgi:uncharacterized protein YycO
MGKLNYRMGRPYESTDKDKMKIKNYAKPGMILLSATNYEVSNWFIPGFWTHSSIIGPTVNWPKGQIIEAIGEGVRRVSVNEFVDTHDYFHLLRPKFRSEPQMAEAAAYADLQVGKPYDERFYFTLTGNNAFSCSELCWWSYEKTYKHVGEFSPFVPRLILGQYSVLPQDFSDAKLLWETVYISQGL